MRKVSVKRNEPYDVSSVNIFGLGLSDGLITDPDHLQHVFEGVLSLVDFKAIHTTAVRVAMEEAYINWKTGQVPQAGLPENSPDDPATTTDEP